MRAKPVPVLDEKTADRFWARVKRGAVDECWKWLGERKKGYGRVEIGGVRFRAHRVAFALGWEMSPDTDMCVCHTCDNPICMNPEHLVLQTQLWNIRDRQRKGRNARGEQIPNALFLDAQAAVIKCRLLGGENYRDIATELGVGNSVIYGIGRGLTYRHVEPQGQIIPDTYKRQGRRPTTT